ncbi:hypothetical protein N8223_02215 [Bacteroidia bacterium]|nr:hypothetical protein [Bacteroidia bacterium]MDC1431046.1 hypothetical protein [Bacteroidia bacterium]
MNIKKILSIFAVALFISALFTSCRSRDACPGVSQVSTSNTVVIG